MFCADVAAAPRLDRLHPARGASRRGRGRIGSVRTSRRGRGRDPFGSSTRHPQALRFVFAGTYSWTGSTTTLVIEHLGLRVLGVRLPLFDVREGKGLRGLVERIRGGRKNSAKKSFQKRPNIYQWCYADDAICVARGSSGNTAVWVRVDDVS